MSEAKILKKELSYHSKETIKCKNELELTNKENENYLNQIIILNKELEGLKNDSTQHVVEKKILEANAQTSSKALLKIQNNIEIFKVDFQHLSKIIINKMNFYKKEFNVTEKNIMNIIFDTKNQRDESINQICECKIMINELKDTCVCQQIIIDAKDHKYEKMVEEINDMKIKNSELNSTISEFIDKLYFSKNESS